MKLAKKNLKECIKTSKRKKRWLGILPKNLLPDHLEISSDDFDKEIQKF